MAKTEFDELMSIGIDIGKDTFHLVGFNQDGQRVLRKQIKRLALIATFEELPRCVVGMEACLSAHFVSRTLRKMGFEPRIIPAIYVKPFNKGQKNDYNDAEAIAEAALRPNSKAVSTTGPISPNAIRKTLKRFDADLTAHGFRNAIKGWCRSATPPVPDHIADAFCDHSLRGLDAAYRRGDTSTERADLSARLCDFVTGVKA